MNSGYTEMSGDFTNLLAATAAFVLGHFLLSAGPLRAPLVARLGRYKFLALYSLLALAAFIWMNIAYVRAPFEQIWGDPLWTRWLSVIVMPIASILLTTGYLTANPGAVGMDALLKEEDPAAGIQKVTRHPILWAIALWAGVHIVSNGDMASLIFFGGFLGLSLGGMAHIEARKIAEHGDAWRRFREKTGFIPFAGLLTGRIRVRCRDLGREIGWGRILAGLVLYFVFLFGHRFVIDVPLLPGVGI